MSGKTERFIATAVTILRSLTIKICHNSENHLKVELDTVLEALDLQNTDLPQTALSSTLCNVE
jgi:hypothetical protein